MEKDFFDNLKRGDVARLYKIHVQKMNSVDLPHVDYNTFYCRLFRQKWNLYRAIHTPARVEFRNKKRRKAVMWQKIKRKFLSLFRRNDRGGRSKRH